MEHAGRQTGMTEMEQSVSALIEKYAVPFGEMYFLRDKEDFVYVCDQKTYDMYDLTAQNAEELFPGYQTRKCYQVLQGRDEPCEFCTNRILEEDRYYTWLHKNERTGRNYLLKDRAIMWKGKKARMEVVMDITDPGRKTQLLLENMEGTNVLMRCSALVNDCMLLRDAMQGILADIGSYFQADSCLGVLFHHPHLCERWPKQGKLSPTMVIEYPSDCAIQEWESLLVEKKMVVISNMETAQVTPLLKEEFQNAGIRSFALVPIRVDEHLYGFLALCNISHNLTQIALLDMVVALLESAVKKNTLTEENMRLMYRDPLTGYLNFAGFKEEAARQLALHPEKKYALHYCDIKRFKYINDSFGYVNGDRLLQCWIQVIADAAEEGETFGRISGDKMAMLLSYDKIEDLKERYWKRVRAVEEYKNRIGLHFEVEIMTGVYVLKPEDAAHYSVNQMLDWANVAQKSVKTLSGSRLAFFTEEMWRRQRRELEICSHLKEGIKAGEFEIWFQPQYDYGSGQMSGAEALVRWNHPVLGRISPAEFIPVLERTGRIWALDEYVWEQACRYLQKWSRDDKMNPVAVSVNVSRMDLHNLDLSGKFYELMQRYGLPVRMLHLEITESAYMEEPDQLISAVDKLQKMGFIVEMDDFGSGYSSLNMLKDVPVDVLKMDMRFLSKGGDVDRGDNILSSVLRMANWLKLPVIAEGVETQEQADFFKNLGCTTMQGYFFARPMPAAEFEKLLLRQETAKKTVPELQKRRQKKYEMPDVKDLLLTEGGSSYLFNYCIGAAALLEYDGRNAEALMLNDAFYRVNGVDQKTFGQLRLHMQDAVAAESRAKFRQAFTEAASNGEAVCEVRSVHHDRRLRVHFTRLAANPGNYILFALVDNVTGKYRGRKEISFTDVKR